MRTLDRLSNLPDSLLIEILSLLKPREVAQTCILSKRWLKVWSFVPSLCFDIADFLDRHSFEAISSKLEKFRNFVTLFLLRRDEAAHIHTFRLLCNTFELGQGNDFNSEETAASARQWVLYALKRNPKILEVSFSGYLPLNIPDCFFTCETLEDVNLRFNIFNEEDVKPQRVCLPRLRSLFLTCANFSDDYLKTFLSGCPVLESLSMDSCIMPDFSTDTVKRFRLMGFPVDVTISAPAVEILDFDLEDSERMITLEDASNITHATFSFYEQPGGEYRCNLLSSLSSVEHLWIDTGHCKQMLETELPKCPTFSRLKNLTLRRFCIRCAFDAVSSLLDHCPKLEELSLWHTEDKDLCQEDGDHSGEVFNEKLEQVEGFPCEGLKTVKIMYCESDCMVHELERLILQGTRKIKGVQITLTMRDVHEDEYRY